MALAGETRWQSEGIRQESASQARQPAKDGGPGPGPVLPQSLTERQSFSVCSSWPGSIHSLCCLCSGLQRPGPSLQRLSQPSQTARHVNARYGSERAGPYLSVFDSFFQKTHKIPHPEQTFHCSWESLWSQPSRRHLTR